MANEKARTHTVANAASATYAGPSDPDSLVSIRNIDGTNGVWINYSGSGFTASAEGSNCDYIGPGETMYLPWDSEGYVMRAVTGDVKVIIANAQGRNRL